MITRVNFELEESDVFALNKAERLLRRVAEILPAKEEYQIFCENINLSIDTINSIFSLEGADL